MRPSQRYVKLMKYARLCSAICGADVADPNYRVNFITACVCFCITVYFIFTIYTVQLKFSEDWGVLLESFCMVGSVLQGISKLLSGICFTKIVAGIDKFLFNIYDEYEKKSNEYVQVLNKCVSNVTVLLKFVAVIYICFIVWSLNVPIILYFVTGHRYMSMQFYLPGLDVNTNVGYFATVAMQSSCLIFGTFGNFAGDLFMMIFNTHMTLLADIFAVKIADFNIAIENGAGEKCTKTFMEDIIHWHQKYITFAKTSDMIFYWITFVQISTSGLSIVLTLYIHFVGNWPGSYAYLSLCFSMLYVYCGIGTLIEITNDKICDEIYNVHWYKLPVPQQKSVLLMLMISQDPILITVGGVMPLSVNTGLQVTKSIYSILMMIMNFVE